MEKKELTVLQAHFLRELISQANIQSIKKEDVVNIIHDDDTWFLLYYK
jgi:hypothetical protein